MYRLIFVCFLVVACGAPAEPTRPFIKVTLLSPDGFSAPPAELLEVTTSSVLDGSPISNTNEIEVTGDELPTSFVIRFSEPVRGSVVNFDMQALSAGVSVYSAKVSAVADVSEIEVVVSFCGDEATDPDRSETCDEGAANSDTAPDACRLDCQAAGCGDLIIDSAETCDDGNTDVGDGCRSDCTQELCGDGIVDPQEQCDDGNTFDNDGCDGDCVPTQITQISAGGDHTCVLFRTHQVKCWGANSFGQLGYGNTENIGDDELPSSIGVVDLGGDVAQISAGKEHTCAVMVDGSLFCWGQSARAQIGLPGAGKVGDDETPTSVGPVDVGGFVVRVSAGNTSTCALLDTGTVRCWGFGALGYPGNTLVGDDETPSSVGDLDLGVGFVAASVDTDGAHACASSTGGVVRCWGVATDGVLGIGFGTNNPIGDNESPSFAPGILSLTSLVSAANIHTCALLTNGNVTCWGNGLLGHLGFGDTNNIGDDEVADIARTVNVGGNVTSLSAGRDHTCVIVFGGAVHCWGSGANGALGYGNTDNIGDDELPSSAGSVDTGGNAILLSAGGAHTCVVLDNQKVHCWGANLGGQLGYGNQLTIGDNETPASAGDILLF